MIDAPLHDFRPPQISSRHPVKLLLPFWLNTKKLKRAALTLERKAFLITCKIQTLSLTFMISSMITTSGKNMPILQV